MINPLCHSLYRFCVRQFRTISIVFKEEEIPAAFEKKGNALKRENPTPEKSNTLDKGNSW